jgi:signal transduction histidine kinase
MGYDTLSKLIECTESTFDLDERLKKVAKIIVKDCPFDACVFYTWDEKERVFRLRAAEGGPNGLIASYGENDGLPGLVKRKKRPVEAYTPRPEIIRWGRTEDRGLEGFKSAAVYPLREKDRWFGILYLKARRKLTMSPRKKKFMNLISKHLTTTLKCGRHSLNLKNAYAMLKDTQAKLVQSEKLMVLAELSASLAHEIKNPLVSIGGFASRLKKKIEPDSPLMVYVEYIVNEVSRLEEIMDTILAYTEDRGAILSREDINSIIVEALSFFTGAFQSHHIEVVKEFAAEPVPVRADRQQLKIAFDNLIANAIQSMERGGTLTVRTSMEKDGVVVDVTDSGGGIDPRFIGNIFNPFFTTKESGTGLGLDITQKIITKHKGHIEVANDVGRGVTFSVKLPHLADIGPAARSSSA